ncbi:helix-turn-helix domain-containing protein [Agarivorans sp. OAG1]|uniref:helix-turn-helix domain-containing protein n=1 Tax=Agarivorans sp. OAG1 TaxID=3082387 RepID=UPI0030D48392
MNPAKQIIHQLEQQFLFSLFKPKGQLAQAIQGLWSASVEAQQRAPFTRWLHADGCSGVLFNLGPPIRLEDKSYSSGVIVLPVNTTARSITLSADTQLAGFRFNPGVSVGFFGKLVRRDAEDIDASLLKKLQLLHQSLVTTSGHNARIVLMYKWLQQHLGIHSCPPQLFKDAIELVEHAQEIGLVSDELALSQRQLERQFKALTGMTPKQWQRTIRVKNTFMALKTQPDIELAALAVNQGFSDQAHMTRECKTIGKITPKQYLKLL